MSTERLAYPTDLSDAEWTLIEPFVPGLKPGGRPFKYERREIVNAILYVARAGCAWRMMPHDLPHWKDVYHYFNEWSNDGTIERIHDALRGKVRASSNRNPEPKVAAIDSQSVKMTDRGGIAGYDGNKKIKGRKRHIIVDSLGLLLAVSVTAANVSDRKPVFDLAAEAKAKSSRLDLLRADQGYASRHIEERLKSELGVEMAVTKRNKARRFSHMKGRALSAPAQKEKKRGFQIQPGRWVVERTFGWMGKYRRLAKDFEYKAENSRGMIYTAMINTMVRRVKV